ncbi:putative NAD(P) dependent oxidoreductase [Thermacetogenium phaeum DSM 12270]|uniref:Putative NAD(P) dependent oxidoreductase n=1 Tax=Thermacetogenium phaeum (strain ATCC BAA-254 / DSM 26808 / PB) TaxID=1089553 RepID=K4LIN6_THEPS|nr:putative NAD(P) dependent oxidoreductase [Thermacetogenium phaeum DSM 12270]MDK2881565.1 hypothetical protein [Clostridia bacterium]
MPLKLGFIGAGKVGSAFAVLLQQAGYEVVGVASRSRESADRLAQRLGVPVFPKEELASRSQVLFLTTSDDAIASVAAELAEKGAIHPGQILLHMSGAHSSQVLAPAAERGAVTLSVHPIQSFASVDQAVALLPGSYFSIEGDERGYGFAREMVEKLKGKHFILKSESKVLYHAAACTACNYLVGLLDVAAQLLEAAGVPGEVGLPAFFPLVEGTFENVKKLGIPGALTGPISRGDLGTVAKHLAALEGLPQLLDVYKTLGLVTVEVALKKGTIDEERAAGLRSLLQQS